MLPEAEDLLAVDCLEGEPELEEARVARGRCTACCSSSKSLPSEIREKLSRPLPGSTVARRLPEIKLPPPLRGLPPHEALGERGSSADTKSSRKEPPLGTARTRIALVPCASTLSNCPATAKSSQLLVGALMLSSAAAAARAAKAKAHGRSKECMLRARAWPWVTTTWRTLCVTQLFIVCNLHVFLNAHASGRIASTGGSTDSTRQLV